MHNPMSYLAFFPSIRYSMIITLVFSVGSCAVHNINDSVSTIRSTKTIDLEITTHLGDNQIFQSGDIVYFYLSHSIDAFLLLIYQDAANNLYQILPSKIFTKYFYEAADYSLFPQSSIPFQFEISAPLGTETIWFLAASKKFPEIEGIELENGLKDINLNNIADVINFFHSFLSDKNLYFGQTKTSFITVRKIETLPYK